MILRSSFRRTCAVALTLLFAAPAWTQLQDERAVKAALVFNLTKYTEWPQVHKDLFVGFFGDSAAGQVLKDMLEGKISESRTVHVLLFPSDEQLAQCDVLYVTDPSPPHIRAALDKARNKAILTVGDQEFFARDGGIVGLVHSGEQIQVQVNLEAAQESRLRISSRLLNIAVIVQPATGGTN
jgi:hypothetical protein